jgi:NAD(P)-dependent dehydrogenase (short-subunit alcohol dehydrogenase family)
MNDKVAIITGASSGIGRAAALLFADDGARVVAVGRNEKELSLLRDEARDRSGSSKYASLISRKFSS